MGECFFQPVCVIYLWRMAAGARGRRAQLYQLLILSPHPRNPISTNNHLAYGIDSNGTARW